MQRRAAGIIREWPGLCSPSSFAASPRRRSRGAVGHPARGARRRLSRQSAPARLRARRPGPPAAERRRLHRRPAQPGPRRPRATRSAPTARSTCCRPFPEDETMDDRAWSPPARACSSCAGAAPAGRWRRATSSASRCRMLLPPDGSRAACWRRSTSATSASSCTRSDDAGASWQEVAAPAYPEQPADATGPAWKLVADLVARASAAARSGPGRSPAACSAPPTAAPPGSWSSRSGTGPSALEWFGGGYDAPGIHSICPHPATSRELLLGISCGGVWVDARRRRQLALQADGMRAAYMPPEQAGNPNIQDPHAHRPLRRPTRRCSGPSTTTASCARPTTPPAGTR